MALNRLFQALAQQQNAPAQPALGSLQKTAAQPAPFQPSSAPWQNQLSNAIDWSTAGGDAWNTIGKEGVINYMGDSLRKRYGTDNLSNFRYVEDAGTPGGYRLDWVGREENPTSFLSAIKRGARQAGIVSGAPVSNSSDGSPMTSGNPSEGLDFGATWEGKGGTTFGFYRKPDGSVGIRTGSANSNDTGDIIAGLATVAGGMALGGALGGAAAGGAGAAGGAAGAGAAEGAAAAGLTDLGGGLAMAADGSIVGTTMAGGAGMSGAALDGFISGAGLGGSGAMGAGAAGITDLGGGLSMGADGAITGATGLNPSTLSNAGIMDSVGYGSAGVGGAGGAGGGGSGGGSMTGTPPPANPYNPASYLNSTNLSNLAKSGMSNFSWTDLIGPGLQLVGGAMNAKAAGDAADAQLQAAREAAARFEPWRQAGAWGVGRAATMLGKEGPEAAKAAFQVDPGYQWRVEKGENALTRAAAARGLLGSGKFLKDAMRFNQGEASQEFGNAYNRLTNLAGLGQTATQSSADYLTQGANAQAAGRVGQANAWNNALGQGLSMYSDNRLMRGLGY